MTLETVLMFVRVLLSTLQIVVGTRQIRPRDIKRRVRDVMVALWSAGDISDGTRESIFREASRNQDGKYFVGNLCYRQFLSRPDQSSILLDSGSTLFVIVLIAYM